MSCVFVIGAGPMMDGGARRVTAHAVRTWHFVAALQGAGHDVTLCTVSTNISSQDPVAGLVESRTKDGFSYENLDMRAGNMLAYLADRCKQLQPDCVVGVSTQPASWACRMEATVPIWADLHGWVMAEAQVKAARDGDDRLLGYFWSHERPVLRRADRISAVSNAQRFALYGELATVGRLNRHNLRHDLVVTIPSSVDPITPAAPQRRNPIIPTIDQPDAFVVLWNGAFNTWTDETTLFEGLEWAMAREPSVHFVATGGPVPGHADSVYNSFRERVEHSPHRSRYHLLDWLAAEEFPACLAAGNLALCVDFPCLETWTGTRTRLLEAMAAGLPILMTRGTELSAELERAGVGWTVGPADPKALGEMLLACARARDSTAAMGVRSREFVRDRFSIERTMEPVVRWAERPGFAPDNAVKRAESPSISDAAVNELEAAARALDNVEDIPSLVEARAELDRLRQRRLFRWLLRRHSKSRGR